MAEYPPTWSARQSPLVQLDLTSSHSASSNVGSWQTAAVGRDAISRPEIGALNLAHSASGGQQASCAVHRFRGREYDRFCSFVGATSAPINQGKSCRTMNVNARILNEAQTLDMPSNTFHSDGVALILHLRSSMLLIPPQPRDNVPCALRFYIFAVLFGSQCAAHGHDGSS